MKLTQKPEYQEHSRDFQDYSVNTLIKDFNNKLKMIKFFRSYLKIILAQLLTKYRIRAAESSEILLKVIKNPITDHLPMGAPIIATSEKSRIVDLDEYVKDIAKLNKPVVFVVGAISTGDLNIDYNEDSISVSSYPLSAAVVCSKLCNSFEKIYDLL